MRKRCNTSMDLFTLHIEHAVLLGLLTVLTLINCRVHNDAKGVYWFPAYTLCAFIGAVFIALRGHGVTEATSIVCGMTFFHVAYLCLHRGLDGFFEGGRYLRWPILVQFGAVLVAIIGLIEFGVVHPNTGQRLVFYSMIFAFQTGLIAAMLFHSARGYLAVPGMLMGSLLGLLGLDNLVRAGLAIQHGTPANYLQVGLGLQLSLLETTVLQGGITVAFVWMTAAMLHERLDKLASTDSLTGLRNRRALEIATRRAIAASRKSRHALSAILIDLDRFKQINDTYGHSFGDRVLLEVGQRLQTQMRATDVLARVGGDEFAIMLDRTSADEALEIAERLRASIEHMVVTDGRKETRVFASFGLAEADISVADWNDLAMKCDKAVYAVKEVGGNLAVAM